MPHSCFLEGTKILCKVNGVEQYVAIETIRPRTLVKTEQGRFVPVDKIGSITVQNSGVAVPLTRAQIPSAQSNEPRTVRPASVSSNTTLYVCSKANYPELTEDLTLTGFQNILASQVSDQQVRDIIQVAGRITLMNKKHCLPACADSRATVVATQGSHTCWNFSLIGGSHTKHGVYANGLSVASSCGTDMKSHYALVQ